MSPYAAFKVRLIDSTESGRTKVKVEPILIPEPFSAFLLVIVNVTAV